MNRFPNDVVLTSDAYDRVRPKTLVTAIRSGGHDYYARLVLRQESSIDRELFRQLGLALGFHGDKKVKNVRDSRIVLTGKDKVIRGYFRLFHDPVSEKTISGIKIPENIAAPNPKDCWFVGEVVTADDGYIDAALAA